MSQMKILKATFLIISATKTEIAEINKIIQNKKSISIEKHIRKKILPLGKCLIIT